jgi:hypothetical protein
MRIPEVMVKRNVSTMKGNFEIDGESKANITINKNKKHITSRLFTTAFSIMPFI